VERLVELSDGKAKTAPILAVSTHPGRTLEKDLKQAGIPKVTPEGKVDFPALRTTFGTLVVESGANVKEAQTHMRHSTPQLT
jgi:integrase